MKMLSIIILSLGVLSGCVSTKDSSTKQKQTSSEFLSTSCLANDFEACTALGLLAGAKNEFQNAKNYLMKACDGKNVIACKELALIKEKMSNNSLSAKPDLMRACRMGSQESCSYLRVINFNDKKTNELYSMFEKRCERKDPMACLSIGYGMADAKNYGEAKKYFAKACLIKSQQGCIAQAHYEFITYEFEKAIALYKDLCKENFKDSCQDLKKSQSREEL